MTTNTTLTLPASTDRPTNDAKPADEGLRELLRRVREHGLVHVGNHDPAARQKYNELLADLDAALEQGK